MTYNADISSMKTPNAATASAAASKQNGIGGGKGVGINNIGANPQEQFVNMIISRLQQDGVIPNSADVSSPSQPAEALKTQLQEIISQLGQNQAPVENAGNAELFQNGTATPSNMGNNAENGANASGLLNNGLLAQQLNLDASDAGDAEIISALQDIFADMGIEMNMSGMNANATSENMMHASQHASEQAFANASDNAKFNRDTQTQNSSEPLSPETPKPQYPAQDISAHLDNQTSPQGQASKSSPAQPQNQAASVTSPQTDTNNLASSSPLADQIGALDAAVTGDDFLLNQTHLSTTGVAQSFVSVEAAAASANRAASAPAATQAAGAANPKAKNNSNSVTGAAPHQKAANSPLPLSSQAGTADGQAAQQPSATTQNLFGRNDGAAPTPDFMSGQDFLNGFNGQSQSFDNQMAQQMRPDGIQNNMGKSAQHASLTGQAHRPATPPSQQQIVRAITLNMTRGANNAIEQMTMQLEPAEMGRVHIDLKMGDDGMLKAHITTDKAETLQALQKDSSALNKAMQDAGLDMGQESFTFDLRDQNDQTFAEKDGEKALFDLSHVEDIDVNDMNANDNLQAMYGQFIRPSGVNVYV